MARKLTIIALVACAAVLSLLTARSPVASEIRTAAPRPGSLDPTFGPGGKVITDIENGSYDVGFAVAVQRDGRIIVVGENATSGRGVVVRYKLNGALDSTFDGDGKVLTDFAYTLRAVALQPDRKIVVAGEPPSRLGTGWDFALLRYKTDGSLDTGFGGDGTVATHFGRDDWPVGVAIQPDGKIVLAGWTEPSVYGPKDVALARYNRDGTLDGSFDGDGKVVTDVTGGGDDDVSAVAVQADGRIVVGGTTRTDIFGRGFLLRYLPNGRLDPAFDGDGRVVVQSPTGYIGDVALQGDGKIVTSGVFSVVRFNSNGSVDTGFGDGGLAHASFQVSASGGAVTIQPNGKIVVGGSVGYDVALARFRSSGALDTSFGSNGTVETDLAPGGDDTGWDVGVAPDGKIVLVGASRPTSAAPFDFAVARYLGDPPCRVPNVRGKKLRLAKSAITNAHCSLGKLKRKASKRMKRNRVISQSPTAGTTLPNLGKVNLVLSRGRK